MTDLERRIIAAQGYVELGLYAEAQGELSLLPPDASVRPDVTELVILCRMGEHHWDQALGLARKLCMDEPTEPGGFIHAAYCLHELGRTEEALDLLTKGPDTLRAKPVYYYNLGCYHARLGHIDEALKLLEQSFEMDGALRSHARKDPDLAELRSALAAL